MDDLLLIVYVSSFTPSGGCFYLGTPKRKLGFPKFMPFECFKDGDNEYIAIKFLDEEQASAYMKFCEFTGNNYYKFMTYKKFRLLNELEKI